MKKEETSDGSTPNEGVYCLPCLQRKEKGGERGCQGLPKELQCFRKTAKRDFFLMNVSAKEGRCTCPVQP